MTSLMKVAAIACLGLCAALPVRAQNAGVTSGPAAGTPATLGTGGQSAATPHQTGALGNSPGAALTNENQGQSGGTTVQPGLPDAGAGVHGNGKP